MHDLVRAGCDHLKTCHHFWRACQLLYNDLRQIHALPNGELRSDFEKFITDKSTTHRYGEVKEKFSEGNCLAMVDDKRKFENADWIIEYLRKLSRHGEGMDGVWSREGGGEGFESGCEPTTMSSSRANALQGGMVASGGKFSPPPPPPAPPLTLGGNNSNEMQMGGAVAFFSEGTGLDDGPSGEEGDHPPRPSVGADSGAGSLSSAGDKRKAPESEEAEEEDDEV